MSILPDCRVFDYSANFSTHDSTVPNKTPRGIPMVLCVRSSVRDCGRVRIKPLCLCGSWRGSLCHAGSHAYKYCIITMQRRRAKTDMYESLISREIVRMCLQSCIRTLTQTLEDLCYPKWK
jgi:hypothetical protein